MRKLFFLQTLLLLMISCSTNPKARFYINPDAKLDSYGSFYLKNSSLDAHDLTSPFIDLEELNYQETMSYGLYYEMGLKNLTVYDGDLGEHLVYLYLDTAGVRSQEIQLPSGMPKQKFNESTMIITVADSKSRLLLWEGWIDLSRLKMENKMERAKQALRLILLNFHINPIVGE